MEAQKREVELLGSVLDDFQRLPLQEKDMIFPNRSSLSHEECVKQLLEKCAETKSKHPTAQQIQRNAQQLLQHTSLSFANLSSFLKPTAHHTDT